MMNKLILSLGQKAQSRKWLPRLTFCLLPLTFLVLLFSCQHGDPSKGKTVFNINLDEGLTSLDPAFCRNQNTTWMDNQLYNGLVQVDDSLNIQPCVAKS